MLLVPTLLLTLDPVRLGIVLLLITAVASLAKPIRLLARRHDSEYPLHVGSADGAAPRTILEVFCGSFCQPGHPQQPLPRAHANRCRCGRALGRRADGCPLPGASARVPGDSGGHHRVDPGARLGYADCHLAAAEPRAGCADEGRVCNMAAARPHPRYGVAGRGHLARVHVRRPIGPAACDGPIGTHHHHGLGSRVRHAGQSRPRVGRRDVRSGRDHPRLPFGCASENPSGTATAARLDFGSPAASTDSPDRCGRGRDARLGTRGIRAGGSMGSPSPISQHAAGGRNLPQDQRRPQRFRRVWSSGWRSRGPGRRIAEPRWCAGPRPAISR